MICTYRTYADAETYIRDSTHLCFMYVFSGAGYVVRRAIPRLTAHTKERLRLTTAYDEVERPLFTGETKLFIHQELVTHFSPVLIFLYKDDLIEKCVTNS